MTHFRWIRTINEETPKRGHDTSKTNYISKEEQEERKSRKEENGKHRGLKQ